MLVLLFHQLFRPRKPRRLILGGSAGGQETGLAFPCHPTSEDLKKGRIRRIAIIAMARKLMVALWRYLETGVVPPGALPLASFRSAARLRNGRRDQDTGVTVLAPGSQHTAMGPGFAGLGFTRA
jgi:hypothetical protein